MQRRILAAFETGRGHGVLHLGAGEIGTSLHPTLAYWRDLGQAFVARACAATDPTDPRSLAVPEPDPDEIVAFAQAVPPMLGAELMLATPTGNANALTGTWDGDGLDLGGRLALTYSHLHRDDDPSLLFHMNAGYMNRTGSFDETLHAIRIMKRHGLTVSVMTTVSRWNAHDVLPLVDVLEGEGVDTLAFERLVPEGHGIDMKSQMLSPEELRSLYERLYASALETTHLRLLLYRPLITLVAPDDPTVGALCSVGNNALTVMPDGTVYPCRRLPISLGNILEEGLFKIWYDSEVLWQIRDPDNLKGKCHDCPLLTSCRGCRAMAYFATGDYLAEDPQCWR